MIVERRIVQPNNNNKFPVGMRILAVDDDPICLKLLQSLLRKCQYHVTTRDRAIDALNVLRENRDEFDLVISDVHMPDMDGFKLLELVGLEMDLPVIMLSANGDTKLVMKGITHGACDYLLKPVRLEELQNIWQHVIRKTSEKRSGQSNTDNRDKRSSGQAHQGQQQGGGGRSTNVDQDSRIGKRRKEPVEVIDEEENDENNNDDPSQKKARVVWSVELHRKFVAAVNQLGFEGAVPKKILELMNVEKLTRENVASHLQKYRLYLKRLSSVANQQAHMVAALGGADSSLMHMHSLNFHNFNTSAAAQFHTNNSLRSLPPSGVLSGRLNSSYNLGFNGLSPSGISPLSPTHLTARNNPLSDPTKLHPEVVLGGDQNSTNVLQGMPTSLEFDQIHNLQLQQHNKKGVFVGRDFSCSSSVCDTPGVFPNGYLDSKRNLTSSSSRSSTLPNSSLQLFQSQECKNTRAQGHYGTHQHQSSSSMSMSVVPFDSTSSFSLPDQTQCDGVWAGGIPNQTNHHLPLTTSYTPPGSIDMRKNGSCSTGLSSGLDHSRFNLQQQQQTVLIGDNNNSMAGYSLDQKLDMSDIRAGYNVNSSMLNSSMVSHPVLDASAEQSLDMNGSSLFQGNNSGFGSMSQAGLDTSLVQLTLPEISATSDLNRGYLAMQHARTMGSFSENVGSLEDVVNSMNRWEESGTTLKKVGELGSDVYPMRTCI